MRLFFAINFSAETKSRLLLLRDRLKANSSYGRFSTPENLHLTLAFLGECNDRQTAAAGSALDTLDFGAFTVQIDHAGYFRRYGGDIWWAGVRENPALSGLHGDLSDKLRRLGFLLESRKFTPHITLGREVSAQEGFTLGRIDPIMERVNSVELMKSEHIGGKLTYTAIMSRECSTAL